MLDLLFQSLLKLKDFVSSHIVSWALKESIEYLLSVVVDVKELVNGAKLSL
jgi:hypothetical protein